MIGEILNAVLQETKALLVNTGGQALLKTNFKPSKMPSYTMPLVLIGLEDAPESAQYPGGLTQMDWKLAFNSYATAPDAYVDDDSGFSTSLLELPIDIIRQHFTVAYATTGWLTQQMIDAFNLFGLQFTFTGITTADPIPADSLEMGFKIAFETTSFDATTNFVEQVQVINNITQLNNPPFTPNPPIS